MRAVLALGTVAVAVAAGCASHVPQPPRAEAAATPVAKQAAMLAPRLPKSPDVKKEIMGWFVLSEGERVLDALLPAGADGDRRILRAAVLASIGLDPQLLPLLDLKRPAGIALLNPSLLSSPEVRPAMMMSPITDRAAVERYLATRGAVTPQPWGVIVDGRDGKMHVAFTRGYALVAWRPDLLDAAYRTLEPRLSAHHDAPLTLHVSLENVYANYGERVEEIVSRLGEQAGPSGAPSDPGVMFALRGLRQVRDKLDSVSDVELLADVDGGGLTLTARMDGKPDGAWAALVAEQTPGPIWGAQYLPKDAALVYVTHASREGRTAEADAMTRYLAAAVPSHAPDEAQLDKWRAALEKTAAATTGELAYGVWPGRGGGIGVGGAYHLSDPMGERAVVDAYRAMTSQIGGVVTRALALDPQRFAGRVHGKTRATQLAGVPVHVVEVSVDWPAGSDSERRAFEALFGERLTMGTAFVGDAALFALGNDWATRLETMVGVARGGQAASVRDDASFAEAMRWRADGRVSMSYLETGKMARLAASLLTAAQDLEPEERAAMSALLERVQGGAIVTTTNASGRRYELTTRVPQNALSGAARLNGALWRVALAPLFNPPMMPPMPIPPPHVTPPMRRPTPTAEPSVGGAATPRRHHAPEPGHSL